MARSCYLCIHNPDSLMIALLMIEPSVISKTNFISILPAVFVFGSELGGGGGGVGGFLPEVLFVCI